MRARAPALLDYLALYCFKMSETQQRRFPWIELVLIAVISFGLVSAVIRNYALPVTSEYWIDLESTRVEWRYCFFNLCYKRCWPADWNGVSEYYSKAGYQFKQPVWVKSSSVDYWYKLTNPESTEYTHLEYALFSMTNIIQNQGLIAGPNRVLINQEVQKTLLDEFKTVFHEYQKTSDVSGYYTAIAHRLEELEDSICADDIIPAEVWLADPIPEHYYGEGRIH